MATAFWKGAISFGMVAIPVRMYLATKSQVPSFHMLHKKCLTRPKRVWHCEQDGEYFGSKETVKGYEYTKGQFVVLRESDFDKVPVRTTHTIEVVAFVNSQEVDPLYYDAGYYLEPDELGTKPFALLRETLLKTQRLAIAKVSFQSREHICALRPLGDILVLHTLHYQSEIRPPTRPEPLAQDITPQELEMARSLVTAMSKKFKPQEYRDEYRLALERMIKAKIEGKEVKVPEVPRVEATDLMSALRASVEAALKKPAEKEKVAAGK